MICRTAAAKMQKGIMFESLVVQRQHFAFLQSFQSQWDNFELFMFPLTHSKITYLLPDNRNPEL